MTRWHRHATEVQPKLITAGASAYPREIDFARMREIADSVGAYLFVDMAHIAGLVAGGAHPSPIPHAHFVTTTTTRACADPVRGLIMCKEEFAKKVGLADLPRHPGRAAHARHRGQGGLSSRGPATVLQGLRRSRSSRNAKALSARLAMLGYRIVSGGTDNHVMLVDLRPQGIHGSEASHVLDLAAITVNKNSIPFDTEPITKTGGIRIGTPAMTTRGLKEEDMMQVADYIHAACERAH